MTMTFAAWHMEWAQKCDKMQQSENVWHIKSNTHELSRNWRNFTHTVD